AVRADGTLALIPAGESVTRVALEVVQEMAEIRDADLDVPARAVMDAMADEHVLDESPGVRLYLHDPTRPGRGDEPVVVARCHPRKPAAEMDVHGVVDGPVVEQELNGRDASDPVRPWRAAGECGACVRPYHPVGGEVGLPLKPPNAALCRRVE